MKNPYGRKLGKTKAGRTRSAAAIERELAAAMRRHENVKGNIFDVPEIAALMREHNKALREKG